MLKLRALALPLAWSALILILTSIPDAPSVGPRGTDKVLHFTVYLVLGALCFPHIVASSRPLRTALLTLSAILLFAAFDEFHQGIIPGRYPNVRDWVADAGGATTGVMLGWFIHRRRGKVSQ